MCNFICSELIEIQDSVTKAGSFYTFYTKDKYSVKNWKVKEVWASGSKLVRK